MSNDILTLVSPRTAVTPQGVKAKAGQVVNNTGGFVFEVSPETRLRRFLILGTTDSTYYQTNTELTRQNGDVIIDWATNRTKELVDILLEISEGGRAPKQNPTIFALAAAAGLGDEAGRKYALDNLNRIARTGQQLFLFAKYVEQFRGWGRGLRNAVGSWYEDKNVEQLGYQMAKYRQREGWTHGDLLRKTHPKGVDAAHKTLYSWATNKAGEGDLILPSAVEGLERAARATDANSWVNIINTYNVSWEMLPDAALTEPKVWGALIEKGLPMTALIRQLPRLTNLKLLTGTHLQTVLAQLANQDYITKARIHPMNVLVAQATYAGGHSLRGSSSWNPNVKVIDALDAAFYKAFGNVNIAGKRTLNALDVSGSMDWNNIAGLPLTPRVASAAMSLITLATEPEVSTVAFSHRLSPLNISARQRLDDVLRVVDNTPMGSTNLSLPMSYAQEKGLEIDTFIVWTDNETNTGRIHPFQALRDYRKASGIDARLIVCGMTATNFSIADKSDSGMLDIVGLDSNAPQLIADFSAGRV